jgi:small subunit ribosomal protein S17e
MNRIKRFAKEVLELHRSSFSSDFEKNKEVLAEVTEILSKGLRNQVAGFITREIRASEPREEPENIEVPAE